MDSVLQAVLVLFGGQQWTSVPNLCTSTWHNTPVRTALSMLNPMFIIARQSFITYTAVVECWHRLSHQACNVVRQRTGGEGKRNRGQR